ncbi:MAG: hypothetical protein UU89_C0003G0013 [Parcubacteria group bacterium GW2011_GWC2_42_11]|nr:MAG: hypothetical protein UU89_C0003G0013 [Parcubacteria group bacterium GW2011_GWC2_42_11]
MIMNDTTERCPVHPKYNPFDRKNREQFNHTCNTCVCLFYATECVGKFSGEHEENGEGAQNAQYRIGPLSLEQLGCIRYSLGFSYYHEVMEGTYRTDLVNRIIYVDSDMCSNILNKCRELGCVVYKREWPNPPRIALRHVLHAAREGFLEFWSTLLNPPKQPFVETIVRGE